MTDTAESLRNHVVDQSVNSSLAGGVVIPPSRAAYNNHISLAEIGSNSDDGSRRQDALIDAVAKMLLLAASADPKISMVENNGRIERVVQFGTKPLVYPEDIFIRTARDESIDFRGEREVALLKALGYKLTIPTDFFVEQIDSTTAAVFKQGVLIITNAQLKDQGALKRALTEMKINEKPLLNTYVSRLEKLKEYIEYMNKRCIKRLEDQDKARVIASNGKSSPTTATNRNRWALITGTNEIDGSLQYIAAASGHYMSSRESKDKRIWQNKSRALGRITQTINSQYYGDKYPFPDTQLRGGVREIVTSTKSGNEASIFSTVGQLVDLVERKKLHIDAKTVIDILAGLHWGGWLGTGDSKKARNEIGYGFNGRFKSSVDGLLGK